MITSCPLSTTRAMSIPRDIWYEQRIQAERAQAAERPSDIESIDGAWTTTVERGLCECDDQFPQSSVLFWPWPVAPLTPHLLQVEGRHGNNNIMLDLDHHPAGRSAACCSHRRPSCSRQNAETTMQVLAVRLSNVPAFQNQGGPSRTMRLYFVSIYYTLRFLLRLPDA